MVFGFMDAMFLIFSDIFSIQRAHRGGLATLLSHWLAGLVFSLVCAFVMALGSRQPALPQGHEGLDSQVALQLVHHGQRRAGPTVVALHLQ